MEKILYMILLSLFATLSLKAQDLKIMTYNTHGCSPVDPTQDTVRNPNCRATAAVINNASPDIAILQEVDNFTTWAGNMNQKDSLMRLTGMYGYFAQSKVTSGNGQAGTLILSKYPILEKTVYPLPTVDFTGSDPRIAAVIAIQVNGQKLYIIGTHLDVKPANRDAQAAALVKIINNINYPVIIGGDLNTHPGESPLVTLKTVLVPTCEVCPPTFRSDGPAQTIDHILFNERLLSRYHVVSYQNFQTLASDHVPLMVRLSAVKPINLLAWQFASPATRGNEERIAASLVHPALNPSELFRGPGLSKVALSGDSILVSRAFAAGSRVITSGRYADTSLAKPNNLYFGFNLSIKQGYDVSLKNLYFRTNINPGGANKWIWNYSLDNVHFNAITGPALDNVATMPNGADKPEVALANTPALQHLQGGTTVYFRVYINGNKDNVDGVSAIGSSQIDSLTDYVLSVRGDVEGSAYSPLVAWQMGNPATSGAETVAYASKVPDGLSVPVLKRGPGLYNTIMAGTQVALANGFTSAVRVSSIALSASDTTTAINNDLYYAFELSPKYGYKLSLYKLNARIQANASGGKVWYWKYSTDGVHFNKLAESYYTTTATVGAQLPQINLSSNLNLQHLQGGRTIYFRLYVQGASNSTGTSGFGISDLTDHDYVLDIGGAVEKSNDAPILAWQFGSPASLGNESSINSSLTSPGLIAGTLSRGASFRTINADGADVKYPRSFVAGASVPSSLDTSAVSNSGLYFLFTLKVATSHRASLNELNMRVRSSAGGAKLWYLKYSLDNIHYNKVSDFYQDSYTLNGSQMPVFNLSGFPELQNIPAGATVYFRLYAFGSNATTGSSGVGISALGSTNDYVIAFGGKVEKLIAATLVAWQMATPATAGNENQVFASIAVPGINMPVLTRGVGLQKTSGIERGFSAKPITSRSATTAADTAFSVVDSAFFTYKIHALPGYKISLSTLNYRIRATAGGAKAWYWKYSLDGQHFSRATEAYYNANTSAGVDAPSINLSAISTLQNLGNDKPIYLRVYIQGANNGTSSSAIGLSAAGTSDDYVLKVDGSVAATIPLSGPYPENLQNIQLLAFDSKQKDRVSVENQMSEAEPENDELTVKSSLSPNGDGINDYFEITGISKFPTNQVTIINPNGVTVFQLSGYNNQAKRFDGHTNNGTMLNPGTYYYLISYKTKSEEKKVSGYLILKY